MRHTLKNFVRRSVIFENDEGNLNKFSDSILVSPQEAARHILMDFLAHGKLPGSISWVPHPNFKIVIKRFSLRDLGDLVSVVSEKIQRLFEPSPSGLDRDDAKIALEDVMVEFVRSYRDVINRTLEMRRKHPPLERTVGANDSSVVNCPVLIKGLAVWGVKDFTTDTISEDFKNEFIELVKNSFMSLFNQGVFMNIFIKKGSKAKKANLDEIRSKFIKLVDYMAAELYNQIEVTFIAPSLMEQIFLPSATWVTYQDRSGAISIASLHEIKWLRGKKDGSIDGEISKLVDAWLEKVKRPRGARFSQDDKDKLVDIVERIIEDGKLHNEIIRLLVGYVNKVYEEMISWLDGFLVEVVKLISNKENAKKLLNLFLGNEPIELEKSVKRKGKRKYFFYL
jgi:hypothetical protein